MAILYTIIIFGVIIFVHELGHFIVAKLCGVKVREFSLGMGPAIFKKQGKETLYALRLFPIGGYAAMEGENDTIEAEKKKEDIAGENGEAIQEIIEQEPVDESRSFSKKNVPQRVAICVAGAAMNLLLGFAIIGCTLIGAKSFATNEVSSFRESSVSSQHGLMVNDKIVKVNKTTIFTDRDIVFEMLRDGDGVYDMQVIREGKRVKLEDVKFAMAEQDGKKTVTFDFVVKSTPANFFNGISRAFSETFSLARNSWTSIGDLVTGKVSVTELSGPVGVGQVVSQAAKIGFGSLLSLTAFISISIGMFNLLPFPALDGGRVVIYLIELIRRKPIKPRVEAYINMAGLALLLGLMVVITFKDIWNLF